MTTARSDARFWPLVLLFAAAGLGLRAFHMTSQGLWVDEVETLRVATTPLGDLLSRLDARELQPTAWLSTFYYAVLKGFLGLPHGSVEGLLRLSSVLLGASTIPALAWAVWRLVPPRVALTAALVVAASPFHVWYSQEVRPYVLLVLLATLAVGAFVRALATDRASSWTVFVAATVLALYTHPVAVGLPIVCGLVLLAEPWNARRLRRGLVALVVCGLLFLPAVGLIAMKGANHPADTRAVTLFDLPYALYAYSVGFSLGPSTAELHGPFAAVLPAHAPAIAAAALVFGALVLAGLGSAVRLGRQEVVLLLAWFLVPLLLALVMAALTPNPFNVRYAIISYPAFAVLLALGIWRPSAGGRPRSAWTAVSIGLVLAMSAWSLRNLYADPRYAKEACRELGEVLRAEAMPGDLVLVNVPYMASTVRYYYDGPAPVIGYPARAGLVDDEATAADLSRTITGRAHVWLVLSRTFQGDRDGILRRLLAAELVEDREHRLPGIVAYRFAERDGHVAARDG